MNKLIKISLVTSMALSSAYATEATSVKDMFSNGETSGQIRLGYYSMNPEANGANTEYTTAIGGQLKFETASFNGVSLATALYTSHSISALSGKQEDGKFSDFLTSSEKHYTELGEAYINYAMNGFNIRVGKQLIDTPLADSDDIAITPNTFEAVVASYSFSDLGLTLLGANVQRMQGVDAGYENVTLNSWMDTGDGSTNMIAGLYANDTIEAGIWYYDIGKLTKAIYADATTTLSLNQDTEITIGIQYLQENEEENSNVEGSIAGIMAEASFSGLTAMVAYDSVSTDNGDTINQGFGGGSSYTNMQDTTAGSLHEGGFGDGDSFVASLGYDFSGVNLFTAYGDFEADAIGAGAKGHLTEIDAGISYDFNDGEADISLVYVDVQDKEDSTEDFNEIKLFANYNF